LTMRERREFDEAAIARGTISAIGQKILGP
jgi:hypothetical protein